MRTRINGLVHSIEADFYIALGVVIVLLIIRHTLAPEFEVIGRILDYTEHGTTVAELGHMIRRRM